MARRIFLVVVVATLGIAISVQASSTSVVSQNARVLLCVARLAQVSQATLWYVNANASGGNSGTSWSNAWTDLQTPLTNPSVVSGDEVWVAAGTYWPTTGTSRSSTFSLKSGVKIYGGFAGTETSLSQRPTPCSGIGCSTETILSGEIATSAVTDNCYHVVTANSSSAFPNATLLDGFTIRDGYGDSTLLDDRTGAGLIIKGSNSSPAIENCTITANEVLHPSGTGGLGGGIASASNQNSPTFTSCVISNNKAEDRGGGVYLASPLLASFTGCQFIGNRTTETVDTGGGALFATVTGVNQSARTIRLEDCTFSGNFTTGAPAGAIWHQGTNSTMEISGGVFDGNTANNGPGGGIYVSSAGHLTVKNVLFASNKATKSGGGAGGGAIAIEGSAGNQHIVNCQFLENIAEPTPGASAKILGGALWNGTISGVGADSLFVTNCLFAGNSVTLGDGGAVYCSRVDQGPDFDDYAVFTNVTIADNLASDNAGGVAVETTNAAKFVNCILWNNEDSTGTGSAAQLGTAGTLLADHVAYSCVMGGGYAGTGDISIDPLFFDDSHSDATLNNYRLQPCSLASDSADYDALVAAADPADLNVDNNKTEPTPLDAELVGRWFDNSQRSNDGNGSFPYVDMGAYEVHAPACTVPGDLNGDSAADGRDIQPFVACALAESDACPCGDFDLSGRTTRDDFACFAKLLLTGEECGIACESGQRVFADCNTNGIPDINDIDYGTSEDCNANGIPDECDIDEGDPDGNELVSADVNTNGIPDECEADCNANDVPDAWDIAQSTSDDVNTDDVPDECQPDCNTNGIPDAWDIAQATSADCNGDGEPDECSQDCNTNSVPDDCDIDPTDPDGDEWVSPDCNGNGFPDECDLAIPPPFGSSDCNTNTIPDECDIASCESDPACDDCNENGIPDSCDIAAEISEDANTNGIPDECEGEGFMGGGGESMMMGGPSTGSGTGGEGTAEGGYAPEAWEAFYEWSEQQCWGPECESTGAEQFAAMAAKLKELGLPVTGRPMGP